MCSDEHEVCRELDDLVIRTLELMEEEINCKLKIEAIMKTSYLDLAKARYIMGNSSVSYLQLPTEESGGITALKTVSSSIRSKNSLEHMFYKLQTASSENIKPEIKQEEESSIRKRTKDGTTREEIEDLEYKNNEENETITDPIKWFGYLVPQNLRQAQKGFQTTLELVVVCANIQAELEATCKRFDELLKLKSSNKNVYHKN